MKFIKFIFGLLFLFNPFLGPFDFLPDFIGLLLIASSIKPLSDVSPSAEASENYLKKAVAVSAVQLVLFIPMLSIINNEPSINLLYSSAFAILRLLFLVPAFHELFNALDYFSDKSANMIKTLKTMRCFTVIYIFVHCIVTALPDIVYLTVDEFSIYGEPLYPLAQFKTGFTFLCASFMLIVGLIWFIIMTVLTFKLKNNKSFNTVINECIENAERPIKKQIMRSVTPAVFCLIIASVSLITHYIDGKPIIPPFFAPALQLFAIVNINKVCHVKFKKIFSILALVFSVLLQIGYELFCFASHERALFAFNDVKDKFYLPLVLNVIYSAFLILSVITVGKALNTLVNEHTGMFWENEFITHNSNTAKVKIRQLQYCKLITLLNSFVIIVNLYSYGMLYKSDIWNNLSAVFAILALIASSLLYSSIKTSVIEKYSTSNTMS